MSPLNSKLCPSAVLMYHTRATCSSKKESGESQVIAVWVSVRRYIVIPIRHVADSDIHHNLCTLIFPLEERFRLDRAHVVQKVKRSAFCPTGQEDINGRVEFAVRGSDLFMRNSMQRSATRPQIFGDLGKTFTGTLKNSSPPCGVAPGHRSCLGVEGGGDSQTGRRPLRH